MKARIGTAAWAIPKEIRDQFPADGSLLARYAQRFSCVEINSSFYRPHRMSTYERWAATVPPDFRFSLKVPKAITHERRLIECDDLLSQFIDQTAALGEKREVLLVQLPPSFAFDMVTVAKFFRTFRTLYNGTVVCEPRHPSWLTAEADELLASLRIARVAADPAILPEAGRPGGWRGFAYYRWHGSPRTYYSSYDDGWLDAQADIVADSISPAWCIFDNTTLGAATENALSLVARLYPAAGRGSTFLAQLGLTKLDPPDLA